MNLLRVLLFTAMLFALAYARMEKCDPGHHEWADGFEECNEACVAQPDCWYGFCANDHTDGEGWDCKCKGGYDCNPLLPFDDQE